MHTHTHIPHTYLTHTSHIPHTYTHTYITQKNVAKHHVPFTHTYIQTYKRICLHTHCIHSHAHRYITYICSHMTLCKHNCVTIRYTTLHYIMWVCVYVRMCICMFTNPCFGKPLNTWQHRFWEAPCGLRQVVSTHHITRYTTLHNTAYVCMCACVCTCVMYVYLCNVCVAC